MPIFAFRFCFSVVFMACVLALAACGGDVAEDAPKASDSASTTESGAAVLTPSQQALFDRTCKACHGVPGTGAPGVGDEAAWAERNKQGLETLVDHSINGYGQMPPMGLCMECTQDEFVAFISYMSGLACEPVE